VKVVVDDTRVIVVPEGEEMERAEDDERVKYNPEHHIIIEDAKLIKKAECDFLEIKGYMSVGFARKRLGYERMPLHSEIKEFSEKLLKFLPKYKFLDEKIESRVVLLGKTRKNMKIRKREI